MDSSARSPYRSKGHKSTLFQPPSPAAAAAVPLIIVSPSANRRDLPESPPIRIKPLEVNISAHRGRFSSGVALLGKREISSSTHAISSLLEGAAIPTAVATSRTIDSPVISPSLLIADADEKNVAVTRSSDYARSTSVIVQGKPKDQYLSDTTFVVISPCGITF